MLNDATGFSHIYLACGYTDLRRGIDGLVSTVKCSFHLNPSEEGSIFLFCGRRADRIKALVYEGDGFLLLYKGSGIRRRWISAAIQTAGRWQISVATDQRRSATNKSAAVPVVDGRALYRAEESHPGSKNNEILARQSAP